MTFSLLIHLLLNVLLLCWRCECRNVTQITMIPKTFFATDPPMKKCENGTLSAFSDALGLSPLYLDHLKSRLAINTALKLVAFGLTPDGVFEPPMVAPNLTGVLIPVPKGRALSHVEVEPISSSSSSTSSIWMPADQVFWTRLQSVAEPLQRYVNSLLAAKGLVSCEQTGTCDLSPFGDTTTTQHTNIRGSPQPQPLPAADFQSAQMTTEPVTEPVAVPVEGTPFILARPAFQQSRMQVPKPTAPPKTNSTEPLIESPWKYLSEVPWSFGKAAFRDFLLELAGDPEKTLSSEPLTEKRGAPGGEQVFYPRTPAQIFNKRLNEGLLGEVALELEMSEEERARNDFLLKTFINSRLFNDVVASVIDDVKFIDVNTLTIESPMLNLGTALCQSMVDSAEKDLQPIRDNCAVLAVTATLSSCFPEASELDCTPKEFDGIDFSECYMEGVSDESFVNLDIQPTKEGAILAQEEGNKDLWLLRASNLASHYATTQAPCGRPMDPHQLVPGWETVLEIVALEEAATSPAGAKGPIVLGLLTQSMREECDFLLVARGTITDYEWVKDFTIALTPVEDLGLAHTGILSLSRVLSSSVEEFLKAKHPQCKPNIVVTGFSLGGGVAHVASLLLAYHLDSAKVKAVPFSSPQVLDLEATERLLERVLVRNWVTELDALTEMPCPIKTGVYRCDGKTAAVNFGRGPDFYAQTPNRLVIPYKYLGLLEPKFMTSSFGNVSYSLLSSVLDLDSIQLPAPLQVSANHSCGTACYLASVFCPRITNGWRCSTCDFS